MDGDSRSLIDASARRQDAVPSALMAQKRDGALPEPPRLPERAAIYIAADGSVKFGALFEGLLPVAEAIAGKSLRRGPDDPVDPARRDG
jgi:hypothetical protein